MSRGSNALLNSREAGAGYSEKRWLASLSNLFKCVSRIGFRSAQPSPVQIDGRRYKAMGVPEFTCCFGHGIK